MFSYTVPSIPELFSISSFIYLLNVAEAISDFLTNTHLLGSLVLGILFGPHVFNLLSSSSFDVLPTFTLLGYIGLLLLIFEAGLTTNLGLLFAPSNVLLSIVVALTGVAAPFAFSFLLLHVGYGYTLLQAFAAGAALCSTSLGTTVALLTEELRQQRIGAVLMSAALLDDVVGLVIAGIIPNLSQIGNRAGPGNSIHWSTIARPILVSFAFAFLTPLLAILCRRFIFPYVLTLAKLLLRNGKRVFRGPRKRFPSLLNLDITRSHSQLFLIVSTLFAFVSGSHYAGTSGLFGAYLAGAFLSFVFKNDVNNSLDIDVSDSHQVSDAVTVSVSPQCQDDARVISRGNGATETTDNLTHRRETTLAPSSSESKASPDKTHVSITSPTSSFANLGIQLTSNPSTIHQTFTIYVVPLSRFLTPLFFASIGASLPIQNLFSLAGKKRVVWRGMLYSLLMVLAKVVVGLWVIVWPESRHDRENAPDEGKGVGLQAGLISCQNLRLDVMVSDRTSDKMANNAEDIGQTLDKAKVISDCEGGKNFQQSSTSRSSALPNFRGLRSSSIANDLKPSQRILKLRSSLLLGLAMVARGEIALIVAQLARPLLVPSDDGGGVDEEPFAVVIWAILVTTFVGAVGVGWVLRRW